MCVSTDVRNFDHAEGRRSEKRGTADTLHALELKYKRPGHLLFSQTSSYQPQQAPSLHLYISQILISLSILKMQPSALLFALVASVGLVSGASIPAPNVHERSILDNEGTTLEKRACFKTGQKYGDYKGEAQSYSRAACKNVFSGYYRKGQKFTQCYNLPNGNSVNFSVGLLGHNAGNSRFLGEDECYDGLSKEVKNCARGGQTTYGNWMYRWVTIISHVRAWLTSTGPIPTLEGAASE